MVIFLLSLRCGHCVHRAVVLGTDDFAAVKREAAGRPCPLCGVRAAADEFQVVALSGGSTAAGTVPGLRPDRNFASFGDDGRERPFRRGPFAQSLRKQVHDEAMSLRRSDFEALSRVFQTMYGLQLGIDAFVAGDLARALVWLDQTVGQLTEPVDVAFAYAHIGMARLQLGEADAAVAAFRAAHGQAGADPALRATVAYNLGAYAEQAGRRAEARELFLEAVRHAPPEIAAQARRRLSGPGR